MTREDLSGSVHPGVVGTPDLARDVATSWARSPWDPHPFTYLWLRSTHTELMALLGLCRWQVP